MEQELVSALHYLSSEVPGNLGLIGSDCRSYWPLDLDRLRRWRLHSENQRSMVHGETPRYHTFLDFEILQYIAFCEARFAP